MTWCDVLAFASPFLAMLVPLLGWRAAKRWWTPVADEQLHDSQHVWSRILPHVFIGGDVALLFLALLYGGCGLFAHWCWRSPFCGAAWKSPPWALFSGVAAAPALILLWHWRTVQRGKDQQQKNTELAQLSDSALSNRFADAARLLADDRVAARLGGIYALLGLGREAPEYVRVVVQTLCSFVRNAKRVEVIDLPQSRGRRPMYPVEDDVQAAVFATLELFPLRTELFPLRGHILDFRRADLCGVDFEHAVLDYARFDYSRLDFLNAYCASMQGAWFVEAKLIRADLTCVSLEGAMLLEADLSGAQCFGARFQGAGLNTTILDGADLEGAYYDDRTGFPDGFEPVKRGMRKDK